MEPIREKFRQEYACNGAARAGRGSSTEFTANGGQDPDSTQSEHGGNDRFDSESHIEPDSMVEPLVVEKDDEGGEDAEDVHNRHHFFGRFGVTVDDV